MPASYEETVYTWADRRFHQLPFDERLRKMGEMDPDFAALPPKDQSAIMLEMYDKYYTRKTPPPTQGQIALAMSGIDASEMSTGKPPKIQMQEAPEPPAPPPPPQASLTDLGGFDPRAQRRPLVPGARTVGPQLPPNDPRLFAPPRPQAPPQGPPYTAPTPPALSAPSTPVAAPSTQVAATPPQPAIPGLLQPGNIDLYNRPVVRNPDGTVSTVKSISVGFDEGEVLIPTISDDGKTLTEKQAIDLYRRTGKHLGIFDTPEHATVAAQAIHEGQADLYGKPPGKYPEARILEEEPPKAPPSAAPIFARKSGRVATTPGTRGGGVFGTLKSEGVLPDPGGPVMLPNPYERAQPTIRKAPQVQWNTGIKEDDPFLGPNANPLLRTFSNAALTTAQAVASTTTGTVGGLTQAAGGVLNSDWLRQAGRDVSSATEGFATLGTEAEGADDPTSPIWWARVIGSTWGSMVPVLGSGQAAKVAIQKLVKSGKLAEAVSSKLVSWGPSVMGSGMEGLQAGALDYDKAIRDGKSETEALRQLILVAAGTSASSALALKKGVFAEGERPLAQRVATGAYTEGLQEPTQALWESAVTGAPMTGQDLLANVAGGVIGGGVAAGVLGRAPRPAAPAPEVKGPTYRESQSPYMREPLEVRREVIPPPEPGFEPEPQGAPLPRAPRPTVPETGPTEEEARLDAARADLAERYFDRPWDQLRPGEQQSVNNLIAQGNIGAARETAPAEPGLPPEVSRARHYREEAAQEIFERPFAALSNSERVFVDDYIAQEYMGAPAPGPVPTTPAPKAAGPQAKAKKGAKAVTPPAAPVAAAAAPPVAAPAPERQPLEYDTSTLPPLAAGQVRLYRGETTEGGRGVPEWLKESPEYQATLDATGRWWTADPQIAQWYVNHVAPHGRMIWQDVPQEAAAAGQVTAAIPEVRRFSRDPESELFLPKEFAGKGKPVPKRGEAAAAAPVVPAGTPTGERYQVIAGPNDFVVFDIATNQPVSKPYKSRTIAEAIQKNFNSGVTKPEKPKGVVPGARVEPAPVAVTTPPAEPAPAVTEPAPVGKPEEAVPEEEEKGQEPVADLNFEKGRTNARILVWQKPNGKFSADAHWMSSEGGGWAGVHRDQEFASREEAIAAGTAGIRDAITRVHHWKLDKFPALTKWLEQPEGKTAAPKGVVPGARQPKAYKPAYPLTTGEIPAETERVLRAYMRLPDTISPEILTRGKKNVVATEEDVYNQVKSNYLQGNLSEAEMDKARALLEKEGAPSAAPTDYWTVVQYRKGKPWSYPTAFDTQARAETTAKRETDGHEFSAKVIPPGQPLPPEFAGKKTVKSVLEVEALEKEAKAAKKAATAVPAAPSAPVGKPQEDWKASLRAMYQRFAALDKATYTDIEAEPDTSKHRTMLISGKRAANAAWEGYRDLLSKARETFGKEVVDPWNKEIVSQLNPLLKQPTAVAPAEAPKAEPPPKKPKKGVVPGAKIKQEKPSAETTAATDTGAAGEVKAVPGPVQPGRPVAHGSATAVRVPGESTTYQSHYAVREAEDVTASHNGLTFQANPAYQLENERDYSDPANQERVVVNSSIPKFDPAYLINDNPDATNGPPVIDKSGNVLGGNNRRMILQRVFSQKNHPGQKAYRDMLMAKAAQFGIDPKQVEGMKQPILVRESDQVDVDARRAIADLNKSGTAALTAAEKAAAGGRALSDDTIDYLGGQIEATGPAATLNDVLTGPSGAKIVQRLVDEGVFTMQEKPSLIDSRTGGTTGAARERIVDMLLGRMFRDSDQMRRTPPAVKNKLERIVAPLLRVQSRPEWNLIPDFRDAMDLLEYARAHDITNLEDVTKQVDMFGTAPEFSDRAVVLANAIKSKTQLELSQAVKRYASDSIPTMFGEMGPSEAFVDAFGTGEPGLLERIEAAGKKASERLRQKGITTGEALPAHLWSDPETVRDFAVSIAGDVARGTITFREWARNMRQVYHEIKPAALRRIWDMAQSLPPDQWLPGWRPGMALGDLTRDPDRKWIPKTVQKRLQLEDVTRYLDIQTRNSIGSIPRNATAAEKSARLMEVARQEFADQMKQEYTGENWYQEDSPLADSRAQQAFPELRENRNLHILQKAISAALSNNSQPVDEAYYGLKFWEEFRKTNYRTLPLYQPDGVTRWPAQGITKQLVKLQRMIDALGVDGTAEFMMTPHTTAEIKRFRTNAKGLGKANDIHAHGALVLGGKIGRYFLDIMGIPQDGSTVDKWDARAQYRRLGRLIGANGEAVETPKPETDRKIFMQEHADLAKENGLQFASGAQAVLWMYEQNLYRSLGMDVESTGRAAGAARFLREEGIPYELTERERTEGDRLRGERGGAETGERAGTAASAAGVGEGTGAPQQGEGDVRGTGEAGGEEAGAVPPAAAGEPPVQVGAVPGARPRRETQRGSLSFRRTGQPLSPRHTFLDLQVQEDIDAAGAPPTEETQLHRIAAGLKKVLVGFTRTHQLLDPKIYHQAIHELKKGEKATAISSQKAQEYVSNITHDLDRNQYDLLRYKVLFDDLLETYNRWRANGELPPNSNKFFQMAFGVTPDYISKELPRINAKIAADPKIRAALAKREQIWNTIRDEYTDAMKAAGYDVEDILDRKKYYRHRVLQYIQAESEKQAKLGGGKPRVPYGRSQLKKRRAEAAQMDYSTDYITSEFEVMQQMIGDTKKAQFIAWVADPRHGLNKTPELKRRARQMTDAARLTNKNAPAVDWRDLIDKKTQTEWQPGKRSVFYTAHTIPERMAQELLTRVAKEIEITADDLRTAVALGGKRDGLVIPKELEETFENLGGRQEHEIEKAAAAMQTAWKQWQLISPPRVIKYNIRNLSGDAEITMTGNPNAFKKLRPAIKDLLEYYKSAHSGNPQMSPAMRSWFEMGGFQSTLQVQELGDLRTIDRLNRLLKQHEHGQKLVPGARIARFPEKAWKATFNALKLATDAREGLLRYANYLEYLEQLQKNNGKPENYGASKPEQVDALESNEDKAYKLSNDLLGAYDEVSASGQWTRRHAIPFWSFQELNFRRYKQLMFNAARDQKLAGLVGRKLLGKAVMRSPYLAYRAGALAIKGAFLMALLKSWNKWRFPEEEASLRNDVREKPHIVLGRHEDGSVRYFSRLGNIPDLLEWFDAEDAVQYGRDVLNGRMAPLEALKKWVEGGPIEKIVQSGNPAPKMIHELYTRKSLYPDIHQPKTIYDRTEYLANNLGLGDAYRLMSGKPVPYTEKSIFARGARLVANAFTYESDPGLSASYDTMDTKKDWMAANGIARGGEGEETLKRGAVRNMRLALRLEDHKAFTKYIAQYIAEGGSTEGMAQAIKTIHPLYGLDKAEQRRFRASLTEEQEKKLDLAIEFWHEVYSPSKLREFKAESAGEMAEARAAYAEKQAERRAAGQ